MEQLKEVLPHVSTVNKPLVVGLAAEKQSLDIRHRILRLSNILRLLTAISALLFAPVFFGKKVPGIFIWHENFPYQKIILLFGCLYVVLLAVLTLYAEHRKSERIFLINALGDIFFAVLFCIALDFQDNWRVMLPFLVLTSLLSLLTLNIVQCTVYAFFLYLQMMAVHILWARNRLNLVAVDELPPNPFTVFPLWKGGSGEILGVGLVFAALTLLVLLIGHLANHSRENGILAKINHQFYEQSRRLNEAIITEMPSGLIVVNGRGEIVSMNRLVRERFRIKSSEDAPVSLPYLSPLLAGQFARWQDLKHNSLQPLNLLGESYTATFTPLPIRGYAPLVMISLENVEASYQRVRETRLVSLGRLTAGIAHEIRNPLGSVQSANELINEMSEGDERVQMLCNKIQANTQRINAIIRDILDMFSDRPGTQKLIVLNEFLHEIVENSRNENELEHIPIALNVRATRDYAVYFDPGHLSQVLHNLMLNSVKHSGRDDVEIRISTQPGEGGRSLFLDIADNGSGIAPDLQDRIFEPFFSSRQGTGLGLYLVREMCLANQAHIIYLPKEQGACFRIIMERYLPEKEKNKES